MASPAAALRPALSSASADVELLSHWTEALCCRTGHDSTLGVLDRFWSQPPHTQIVLPLPFLHEKLTANHCAML